MSFSVWSCLMMRKSVAQPETDRTDRTCMQHHWTRKTSLSSMSRHHLVLNKVLNGRAINLPSPPRTQIHLSCRGRAAENSGRGVDNNPSHPRPHPRFVTISPPGLRRTSARRLESAYAMGKRAVIVQEGGRWRRRGPAKRRYAQSTTCLDGLERAGLASGGTWRTTALQSGWSCVSCVRDCRRAV